MQSGDNADENVCGNDHDSPSCVYDAALSA